MKVVLWFSVMIGLLGAMGGGPLGGAFVGLLAYGILSFFVFIFRGAK